MNDKTESLNIRTVLVTLTPLDRFYFGGRKKTHADSAPKVDYYFRSGYFPQQSALLGMIRQELLIQNDCFPINGTNRGKAKALIGEASFDPGQPDPEQSFGVIHCVSPLFIRHKKNKKNYYTAPMDYGLEYKKENSGRFSLGPGMESSAVREFVPKFENYNSKKGIIPQLIACGPVTLPMTDAPAGNVIEPIKGIFFEDEQVGINKSRSGAVQDDGFYKQIFLRMRHGFAFAFYLQLTDTCRFENSMVYFGGERSAFALEIREIDEPSQINGTTSLCHLYHRDLPHCSRGQIVLTSDAFVKPAFLEHCRFAVTESVFFRNIRTSVNTKHYYKLGQKGENNDPRLGTAVNLMKRGSVLYLDDETDNADTIAGICREYLDIPNYRKIGYNYYITYPNADGKC